MLIDAHGVTRPAPTSTLRPSGLPLGARDWRGRAAAALLALGAVAVAAGRDAVAQALPAHARPIEATGYALLLLGALAATRSVALSWRELGLCGQRPALRVLGGLALGVALSVPALGHGVAWPLALAALPGAAAVAAVEELLFRGVLYAVIRRGWGEGAAVLGSSAAFALAHAALYPPPVLLLGLAAGLALGVYRRSTGDLLGPWLGHTLADAATAALAGG